MNRSRFERLLSPFAELRPGEGRLVLLLWLQAFLLMAAYYMVRPVREALILAEVGAIVRSEAVAWQALLLLVLIPAYGALARRVTAQRLYPCVNAIFVLNLVAFSALERTGLPIGFTFFLWASLFAVMVVAQFWAFATDLVNVGAGQRLFGLIAVGISAGAWAGARIASSAFDAVGAGGLMLAAAAALAGAIALSRAAGASVPAAARSAQASDAPAERACAWLGGFALIARSRYLAGIAALVVLLNWVSATGDFVLADWLLEVARREAPGDERAFVGRFMGEFCAAVTLVAFLVQLTVVSRFIRLAGLARALLATPLIFAAGYLLVGMVPVFVLLQAVLVVQRSFDYSLLATARNALLLPAGREAKYQAKTAIDTFFYRLGDLLSAGTVFACVQLVADPRARLLWLIVGLSVLMTLVAWRVGREYARRCPPQALVAADGSGQGGAVLAQ